MHHNDIVGIDSASPELKFAGAVAAFGQALRGGEYLEDFGYEGIRKLAVKGRANDPHGYRGEFISLVNLADALSEQANDRVASR